MIADDKFEQASEPKLHSDRVTLLDGRYLLFYSFEAPIIEMPLVVPVFDAPEYPKQSD